MASKRQETEEFFIKKHHLEEQYARAKIINPQLWETLQNIKQHYENYSKHCNAIVEQTVLELLGEKRVKGIHSARFRVKALDSLLVKIIKKKAFLSKDIQDDYDIEKYRELDANNYYKIITDISGIRILIRYRAQWEPVHNLIWKKYYKGDERYLKNFVNDYKSNEGMSFIVEKPKVYYRSQVDRIFYEQIGKDIFDFYESNEGYNSIHYLINIDGKYIEIQLRTLLDEAWSECTHDIIYKGTNKSQLAELEYLSQCLSQQTIAAETITNLIYEKVNKNGIIFKNPPSSKRQITDTLQASIKTEYNDNVEARMRLLERQSSQDFNGNIDSLI